MDISKIPIEKTFHFLAGIVPGSAILWMFYLRNPSVLQHLVYSDFLGYKTKISILLVLAFLIGNAITRFISSSAGAIGGVLGTLNLKFIEKDYSAVAPWRDRRWRTAAVAYLGDQAPNDTSLMSDSTFALREQLIKQANGPEAIVRQSDLLIERLNYQIDDSEWSSWYSRFHGQLLLSVNDHFAGYISAGLSSNLIATAISILLGTIFVPSLRTLLVYCVSSAFVLASFVSVIAQIVQLENSWSTLSQQIRFLSGK